MRIRLGLLFGGQSAEHEVSLVSARAVFDALDPSRYAVTLIRIEQDGTWTRLEHTPGGQWSTGETGIPVFLMPQPGHTAAVVSTQDGTVLSSLDVVFPVLHGPNGEDGSIQGLIQVCGVACVGAGVLGSSLGMDKDLMKRLLEHAGLPTARGLVIRRSDSPLRSFRECVEILGTPMFLKPANTGSSVGISKVSDRDQFDSALSLALDYDHKVIVEEFIDGREIECAVVGSAPPRASTLGEIVTQHDFYSYQAKYQDENATSLIIPAPLTSEATESIQALAIQAYQVLGCAGMARVDFFMGAAEKVWINEINTIPGFTPHSMYPLLWRHSGLSTQNLIDTLVDDALERFQQNAALKRNR